MEETVSLRLAHLVPCGNNLATDVTANLILNALYQCPNPMSVDALLGSIQNSFGVSLPLERLEKSLNILIEQGQVIEAGCSYVLSSQSTRQLQVLHKEQMELEISAISSWLERLMQSGSYSLNDDEAQTLADDLVAFLNSLFVKHGAESIHLINGTENSVIDFDVPGALACLPERNGKLTGIRQMEFPRFLITSVSSEIRFLVNLIEKAVTYLSGVCDPCVVNLLRERLRNKRVYLDTNVAYRLLGLQGAKNQMAIETTVSLLNDYGVRTLLHERTVSELQNRLVYDAAMLKQRSICPDLAEVGSKYRSDDNYISTYWAATSRTGISVQDFIAHYEHFMDILQQHGVEPDTDDTRPPPNSEARPNELENALRKTYVPRDIYGKSDSAFEHDAHILSFMESSCGSVSPSVVSSPVWFVTADRSLISFVRSASYTGPLKTLVILPSQLLEVLQFTVPANEQYEQCFLNLFAQSYIPSYSRLPNHTIHDILGRINMYRGTPRLAETILSDELLMRRYDAISEDEDEIRDEFVHDALLEKSREIEKELEYVRSTMESDADTISSLSSCLVASETKTLKIQEQAEEAKTNEKRALEALEQDRKRNRQVIGWLLILWSCVVLYRVYARLGTILPTIISVIASFAMCAIGMIMVFGKETGTKLVKLLLDGIAAVSKLLGYL